MLLLEQVIWRDTSKGNMKEWDIPVFIVNMLQLDASDLKRHDESKHEGGRYPCLYCEHAATTASDLKRHVESKHEGVRYPCLYCEYAATRASDLKRHVERKHEGVRYPLSLLWICCN